MVGGGPGSFIGDAHRKSINIDGKATLVAGCFSRSIDKCRETGAQLGIAASPSFKFIFLGLAGWNFVSEFLINLIVSPAVARLVGIIKKR